MDYKKLLEKAYVGSDSLPHHGVSFKANCLKEFPFLISGIFESGDRQIDFRHFEKTIIDLVKAYTKVWLEKTPSDLEKYLHSMLDFGLDIDFKDAFKTIYNGGPNLATIQLPVSNAKMVMRRFGDCLGFRLMSNNFGGESHVIGSAVMDIVGIPEFIHSLELVTPLPKEHLENNSVIIDFANVARNMESVCKASWISSEMELLEKLFSDYAECGGGIKAAICRGKEKTAPSLHLKLSHWNKSDSVRSTAQWRKKNVETLEYGRWKFLDGRDLCLYLEIDGYVPKRGLVPKVIDVCFDFRAQQDEMIKAGATLYLGLSSLAINDWNLTSQD